MQVRRARSAFPRTFGVGVALLMVAGAVSAETLGEVLRAPEDGLEVGGEIRVRPEYNDDYDFDDTRPDSRDFTLLRTTVGLRWCRSDRFSAFVQLRDSRAFGSERNSTGAAGGIAGNTGTNQANLDLHQGYVDYHPGGNEGWTLRLGRQEVILGDHRLVGSLEWGNTARSFDGLRVMHRRGCTLWQLLALQVADLTVSGSGAAGRDDQRLTGLYNVVERDESRFEYYFLRLDDEAIPAATTRGGDNDFHTLGLRWQREWTDRFDTELELAVQDGDLGARELSATAGALILGLDTLHRHKGRFELEYDWSPGDENPADGQVETFQNLFPTNHKFYGIADRFSWRNLRALRLGYSFEPGRGRKWMLDVWKFDLDETTDNWYRASGAIFMAANPLADRDAGWELDVRHRWTDGPVEWEAGVARFFSGDFQTFGNLTPGDDATFAYTQISFPF